MSTLTISHNLLSSVTGIRHCVSLKNLDVSSNQIKHTEDLDDLLELPNLVNLDLKKNQIDDHANVLSFFGKMRQLTALYLQGNPCVRFISQYRKNMTVTLPNLTYLEDKPIWEHERILADAWKEGGFEGERKKK